MRRNDLLYNILLGVIALSLVVIATALIIRPDSIQAQSRADFSDLKLAYTRGGFLLMDSASGEIWMYSFGRQQPDFIGTLEKIGSPLTRR
ncbi:hypothetical protein CSB45_07505 [candidate division KSB3 bacterium]|uniref:Uncharacterized protein n=1 Tax=candidate division KSB3 bacterium TaxID=2044937 RepID=A0A2G6E673_9BACT|nr:MAG: hypothetical protein CSB45_07505 [candidate division KSB3 bacterium]PIE29881.1 MAG: hypothetical protein CSA57_06210 [candidate division KSB3 bacterium]